MAIGANWAEIWADVWGPVWSQTAPEPQPEPEVVVQTPAGSSNRRKRRLYVEIDGQAFEVESAQHAQALFDRAKALAQEAASEQAQRVERKLTISRKVPRVTLEVPEIKASPELKLDLKDIRKQIAKVYQDAAMALEMRLLLERQAQVDEEESIFLLM